MCRAVAIVHVDGDLWLCCFSEIEQPVPAIAGPVQRLGEGLNDIFILPSESAGATIGTT